MTVPIAAERHRVSARTEWAGDAAGPLRVVAGHRPCRARADATLGPPMAAARGPVPVPAPTPGDAGASPRAEAIRRSLADAWGEMGAAWGVAPAIARVHAYLMSRREPLTEREVREALGISHRAASLALAEAEEWGLVERVPMPRRVMRRGPAGVAFVAVNDPWRWFGRIVAQRKSREGDPIVEVLERTAADAERAVSDTPGDSELVALRDWLAAFLAFVRLFDRAVGLVPQVEPQELERVLRLLSQVPDETVLRLVRLLGTLPEADVLALVASLSRLSPPAAVRATRLMSGVIRTVGR
jgi:DNA-binding transcriptional regulator GbsR (MarR family)